MYKFVAGTIEILWWVVVGFVVMTCVLYTAARRHW